MALVRDDEIEGLDRDVRIIGERRNTAFLVLPLLETRDLLLFFREFLTAQHGIETLDRRYHHLGVRVDPMRVEMLDVIGVGEAMRGPRRLIGLKLAQGLVAEIVAVDEEENALRARLANEAIRE